MSEAGDIHKALEAKFLRYCTTQSDKQLLEPVGLKYLFRASNLSIDEQKLNSIAGEVVGPHFVDGIQFDEFLDILAVLSAEMFPDLGPTDAFGALLSDYLLRDRPAKLRRAISPRRRSVQAKLTEPMHASDMTELHDWLNRHGLAAYLGSLRELGVESIKDLTLLTPSDLDDAGMKVIHRRKLTAALYSGNGPIAGAAQPSATTSPNSTGSRPGGAIWEEYATEDGLMYYHCTTTGETTWHRPSGQPIIRRVSERPSVPSPSEPSPSEALSEAMARASRSPLHHRSGPPQKSPLHQSHRPTEDLGTDQHPTLFSPVAPRPSSGSARRGRSLHRSLVDPARYAAPTPRAMSAERSYPTPSRAQGSTPSRDRYAVPRRHSLERTPSDRRRGTLHDRNNGSAYKSSGRRPWPAIDDSSSYGDSYPTTHRPPARHVRFETHDNASNDDLQGHGRLYNTTLPNGGSRRHASQEGHRRSETSSRSPELFSRSQFDDFMDAASNSTPPLEANDDQKLHQPTTAALVPSAASAPPAPPSPQPAPQQRRSQRRREPEPRDTAWAAAWREELQSGHDARLQSHPSDSRGYSSQALKQRSRAAGSRSDRYARTEPTAVKYGYASGRPEPIPRHYGPTRENSAAMNQLTFSGRNAGNQKRYWSQLRPSLNEATGKPTRMEHADSAVRPSDNHSYAYQHDQLVSQRQGGDVFQRLTDVRGYTGVSKHRFTPYGHGKGLTSGVRTGYDSAGSYVFDRSRLAKTAADGPPVLPGSF